MVQGSRYRVQGVLRPVSFVLCPLIFVQLVQKSTVCIYLKNLYLVVCSDCDSVIKSSRIFMESMIHFSQMFSNRLFSFAYFRPSRVFKSQFKSCLSHQIHTRCFLQRRDPNVNPLKMMLIQLEHSLNRT